MKYLSICIGLSGLFLPAMLHAEGAHHQGFIENRGQFLDQDHRPNTEVLYLLQGSPYQVQLRRTGFSYDFHHSNARLDGTEVRKADPFLAEEQPVTVDFHRIDLELVGCNAQAAITTEGASMERINYYTYQTPEGGITGLHTYSKVIYADIYPHIDLEFLVQEKGDFKYNFLVHPGGQVSDIRFAIHGADGMEVSAAGLSIATRFGAFVETIPACSWKAPGEERALSASFIRTDDEQVGIQLSEPQPPLGELVIDPVPVLDWCTYYQSAWLATLDGVITTHAASGLKVIGGEHWSDDMVTTVGAYQGSFGGYVDAFLALFGADDLPSWCTYYGGEEYDAIRALVMNGDHVYAAGVTKSPLSIALNSPSHLSGVSDALLTRFDVTTGMLDIGRYIGGSGREECQAMVLRDSTLYLAGQTSTTGSTLAFFADQTTYGGGPYDGFLAAYSLDSLFPRWFSYVGGGGEDGLSGLTQFGNGDLYAVGYSYSTNGIGTPGTYMQDPPTDTARYPIAVKFRTNGDKVWGSYYPWGVANNLFLPCRATCDDEGIYIAGGIENPLNILTAPIPVDSSSFQQFVGPDHPASYLVKLDTFGIYLWGTYLATYSYPRVQAANGAIYLTAPRAYELLTCGAFDSTAGPSPSTDGLIAKFEPDGNLDWLTYFGGDSGDQVFNLAVDDSIIHFFGGSYSEGLATPGAYQTEPASSTDGGSWVVGRFIDPCTTPDTLPGPGPITGPTLLCAGDTGQYSVAPVLGALCYEWSVPADAMILSGEGGTTITVRFGFASGWVRVRGRTACNGGPPSYTHVVVSSPVVTVTGDDGALLCLGDTMLLVASSNGDITWNTGWQEDSMLVGEAGAYFVHATDSIGCALNSDTITFNTILTPADIIQGDPTPNEFTQSLYVASWSQSVFLWQVVGGTALASDNYQTLINWGPAGPGLVVITKTGLEQCPNSDTLVVTIQSTQSISESAQQGIAVRPIPTTGLLWVDLPNQATENIRLAVYDALTRTPRRTFAIPAGAMSSTLDLGDLADGVYILQLRDGAQEYRTRVVVSK